MSHCEFCQRLALQMIKSGLVEQVYNCDSRLRQCTKATQRFRSSRATRRKACCKTFLKNGRLLAYHNLQTIAENKAKGRFCLTQAEYKRHLEAMMPTKSRSKIFVSCAVLIRTACATSCVESISAVAMLLIQGTRGIAMPIPCTNSVTVTAITMNGLVSQEVTTAL